MKPPTFQYPGGKAKLRRWLLQHFPRSGRTYREPFAGRGNVFFAAREYLRFERWELNDINTAPFLRALRDVSVFDLPEDVDRAEFDRLKSAAKSGALVARALEPKVTFMGKGYGHGFMVGWKPKPERNYSSTRARIKRLGRLEGYRPEETRAVIEHAQILLRGSELTDRSWETLDWGGLGPEDFVYFDPPYLGTGGVGYGNIDHGALLRFLISGVSFRWGLSGYPSDLYRNVLGPPQATLIRNAEMAALSGKSETRTECLWLSRGLGL